MPFSQISHTLHSNCRAFVHFVRAVLHDDLIVASTGCHQLGVKKVHKKMKQPLLLRCVQPPSLQNKSPEFGTNCTMCFLQMAISLPLSGVGIVLGPCLVVADLEGHVRLNLLNLYVEQDRPVEDSLSIPRAHSRLEKDSHPGNTVREVATNSSSTFQLHQLPKMKPLNVRNLQVHAVVRNHVSLLVLTSKSLASVQSPYVLRQTFPRVSCHAESIPIWSTCPGHRWSPLDCPTSPVQSTSPGPRTKNHEEPLSETALTAPLPQTTHLDTIVW